MNLDAVGIPFEVLGFDVLVINVFAEGFANQAVCLHGFDSALQTAGEGLDSGCLAFLVRHLEDVRINRGGRSELLLNAVQTGAENNRQGEVRVAGRVGAAQFDSRAVSAGAGDANERAAVFRRPGDVNRGFVAGNESLVRIDQRVGNGDDSADVRQNASHELVRRL